MTDQKDIEWLEPWRPVSTAEAAQLEAELSKEINDRHPLAEYEARAIGKRDDNDDVLFVLGDAHDQAAVVHLTWKGVQEIDSNWPSTEIYSDLVAWEEQRMKPDNIEYKM